jgi:phosphoribosylanthranilate isomerase
VPATSSDAIREAMDARMTAGYAFVDSGEVLAVSERSDPPYRLLVDNAAGGGSGKTVDAAILDGLDLADAIVAGGLTPANVAATVARLRPFGVDTAGGVESAPGIKDARLIEAFVRAARQEK